MRGVRYAEIVDAWEFCGCDTGQAMKAEDAARRAAADREARHKVAVAGWEKAEIPSRFQQLRLSTLPVSKETAALVARLRCPSTPEIEDLDDPAWDVWAAAINSWDGSWFLWGQYGRGKTGLAISYAREWWGYQCRTENVEYLQSWHQLQFKSTPDLFSELRDTYRKSDASEMEIISKYASVRLLILDDLGAEHVKDSGWLEDRLYQIIGKRHSEELPTIFTSNLSPSQLAAKIGERITWRIVEACSKDHIVKVDGPNLREK